MAKRTENVSQLKTLESENRLLKLDIKDLRRSRNELSKENEELEKDLAEKENELNTERGNTDTYRQLNVELNRKVDEFEKSKTANNNKKEISEWESELNCQANKHTLEGEKTLELDMNKLQGEYKVSNKELKQDSENLKGKISETEQRNEKEFISTKEKQFDCERKEKGDIKVNRFGKTASLTPEEIIRRQDELTNIFSNPVDEAEKLKRENSEFQSEITKFEGQSYRNKIERQDLELRDLQNQILVLTKQNEEIRKMSQLDLSQHKQKLVVRDYEITELREKLERQNSEIQGQYKSYRNKIERQNLELRDLQVQIQVLTKQNQEIRKMSQPDLSQHKHMLVVRDYKITELRKQLRENEKSREEKITLKRVNKDLKEEIKGFEVITKEFRILKEKYLEMGKEKQYLLEQIDGFHTLINTLEQNTDNLKYKLDEGQMEKEEERNKNENLKKQILTFRKQQTTKLNEDRDKLLEEQKKANRYKSDLEHKLKEMTQEIADRDRNIQNLSQIQDEFEYFAQIPSDLNLDKNVLPDQKEKGKEQTKVGVSKISNEKLQSSIKPIPNPTVKIPGELKYRGENVHVVELKALPDPTTHIRKQIVCTVKKKYELGTLVDIFEVQVKVGMETQVTKYVGISLDEPLGNSDGAYQGVQHFKCEPNHGYFSPIEDVYVPVV